MSPNDHTASLPHPAGRKTEPFTPVWKEEMRAVNHRIGIETTRAPDGRTTVAWGDLTNHFERPEKLGVLCRVLAMFVILPFGGPVLAFALANPLHDPLLFGIVLAGVWGLMVPVSRAQKAWARRMRLKEVPRLLSLETNGAMLLVGAFPHTANPRETMILPSWREVASVEVSNGQTGGVLMVGWRKRFAKRETSPADLTYVTIVDRKGGISIISESFWDAHSARQIAVAVTEAVQAMRHL